MNTGAENAPVFLANRLIYSRLRDTIDSRKRELVVRRSKMAVRYDKLSNILEARDLTMAQLAKDAGFSANIITRIRRQEVISMESIEKICKALDCTVDDILEFEPESPD